MNNKSILFFLLFLFSTSLVAQTYYPFPDSTARWDQRRTLYDPTGNQVNLSSFFLDGDTLFNGHTYSRLFNNSVGLCGAIREDSSKKVYYLAMGSPAPYSCAFFPNNQESLLYDFGRAVGDTFYTTSNGTQLVHVVQQIDMDTSWTVPRRRFFIIKGYTPTELWYQDIQLEGMGSVHDLLFPYCTPFEEGYELLCFQDPGFTYGYTCTTPIEEGREKQEFQVEIGPHPIVKESIMRFPAQLPGNGEIEVVDLQGRLLVRKTLRGRDGFPIGEAGLESGMYLYRITVTGKLLTSGKLLVR